MPDWVWMICIFISLTGGYIVGFVCGTWKSDAEINKCPSENAYIREAELNAEALKEIEKYRAELTAQNEMEKFRIVSAQDNEQG